MYIRQQMLRYAIASSVLFIFSVHDLTVGLRDNLSETKWNVSLDKWTINVLTSFKLQTNLFNRHTQRKVPFNLKGIACVLWSG